MRGRPAGAWRSWTWTSAASPPSGSGRGAATPWRSCWRASAISGRRRSAWTSSFAESDRGGEDGEPDAALAKTLRDGRVVLGYAMRFDGEREAGQACAPPPLGLSIVEAGGQEDDPFFRATGALCSLPELTEAAGAQGFLNAAPDSDGILRRVPLLVRYGEGTYPSLGLATVAAMTGTRDVALRSENANTSTLTLDGHRIALDGKSNLLVRYRGKKRTFRYVSAADVMQNRVRPGTFKDTLVMVGTTALGTREVVATPLDTLFVGVEVQATVADNLLQHDGLARPEHGVAIETQLVLVLGVLATLLVRRIGAAWAHGRRRGGHRGAVGGRRRPAVVCTAPTSRRCIPRWASASRWR